jgi:molecular chaperone HscB
MSDTTYFQIFSLPAHLVIDLPALEKSFYALSRKLHPDRFASKSPEEQAAALAESSRLNDAYRTLKDPIARTEYLLKLEGVELEEQSKSATEAARASGTAKKQIVPEDMLEEAFELNMQLEEMRMAKKMGEDDPQLRKDLLSASTPGCPPRRPNWNPCGQSGTPPSTTPTRPQRLPSVTPWSPCSTGAAICATWSAM